MHAPRAHLARRARNFNRASVPSGGANAAADRPGGIFRGKFTIIAEQFRPHVGNDREIGLRFFFGPVELGYGTENRSRAEGKVCENARENTGSSCLVANIVSRLDSTFKSIKTDFMRSSFFFFSF